MMKKKPQSPAKAGTRVSTSSKVDAERALRKLHEKKRAAAEYDAYVANLIEEKIAAGLSREQALQVVKFQIEYDSGQSVAV